MKLLRSIRINLACVCLLSCLMVSCESGGGGGETDRFPSSSESAAESIAGTWSGKSATGQVPSTLYLSESNGRITGRLKWPNDSRTVSGSMDGASVHLNVEGGDSWMLMFSSGNKLMGTAMKPNGKTYDLSFKRESF